MKIVVSSHGTTGDFVPFVALAKALRTRGHGVLAAVNPAMQPLFTNAQIPTASCGPRFGPEEARAVVEVFSDRNPDRDAELNAYEMNHRDLLAACTAHRAELLIAISIQYAAADVARTLGIPWVRVFTTPASLEDEFHPAAQLELLASSIHFSPPTHPAIQVTGFWTYDGSDQPGWNHASPTVEMMLRVRRRPIVFLPGSVPVPDPAHTVAIHAEAARILDRPLLVQRGWADLDAPSGAIFADTLPHDRVLARAAAVITHGGMGILSRALAARCPILVEPWGRDCFFNAARIVELGCGAAADPAKIEARPLAALLRERVLTPRVKEKVRAAGGKLAGENGVERACVLIESLAW